METKVSRVQLVKKRLYSTEEVTCMVGAIEEGQWRQREVAKGEELENVVRIQTYKEIF